MHPVVTGFLIAVFIATFPTAGHAQSKEFRARLSTVPIDIAMQSTIAGNGRAKAVLSGNKLSVEGTFSNLKSAATVARIHLGPKGIRGPSVLELQVTPGTSGTIKGSFDLTPAQVEALTNSRLYIQLHSEKAPEGNLWGWLLPQETRR
jgi:hypothetical protein